tara:strand:- start:466 stop:1032 length:567 start_codon:yes stop_codon:yes gene_type:complete
MFGVPVIVAINHFASDKEDEINVIKDYVSKKGSEAILCKHWSEGSKGILQLAQKVIDVSEKVESQFSPLYEDKTSLFEKIETIAKRIYRADEVLANKSIREQLKKWESDGYGNLPICIAKTQYSFTTDPNLRGAPTNHSTPIREVRLCAGAGFIIVICGDIMTMPGLPKVPSAESIHLDKDYNIQGLF